MPLSTSATNPSKYVASDGKTPKINKLNDGRFQKTKQKVQTQVEDIADDLIKLYAERSQLEGFAYSFTVEITGTGCLYQMRFIHQGHFIGNHFFIQFIQQERISLLQGRTI